MATRANLQRLDRELRESWEIDLDSLEDPGWWERLSAGLPPDLVAEFQVRHEAYVQESDSAAAEAAFYDLVADPRLLGPVHSHRRSVILDAATLVDDLLENQPGIRDVIDVGCHAGYMAAWWARREGLRVVGTDSSRAALELGIRRCRDLGRQVQLLEADLVPSDLHGTADLIVAIDVLPENPIAGRYGLRRLASGLSETGWLVVSSGHPLDLAWGDLAELGQEFAAMGTGFVSAHPLGGLSRLDLNDPTGESTRLTQVALVMRRGCTRELPRDVMSRALSDEEAFSAYLSRSEVPNLEKTWAWFQAQL